MYGLRLLAQYILTLLAALGLNFLLPRIAPGDPLDYLLSEDVLLTMSDSERVRALAELGLDLPLWAQFYQYLAGLASGNFGISTQLGQPVLDIILDRLPWTLLLTGTALILATSIGIVLGVVSARKQGQLSDVSVLILVLFVGSLPPFWLGMMLIILFSSSLNWLPAFGAYELGVASGSWAWALGVAQRLILPATALGLVQLASMLLVARSSMLVALEQDYIVFARSQGVCEQKIFFRHAFRNALLPIYSHAMLGLGGLLGGALVIEAVFAYPGLGSLIVNGVSARDYPLLQGVFFFTTISVILANFLMDLFYPLLDPRTSKEG